MYLRYPFTGRCLLCKRMMYFRKSIANGLINFLSPPNEIACKKCRHKYLIKRQWNGNGWRDDLLDKETGKWLSGFVRT